MGLVRWVDALFGREPRTPSKEVELGTPGVIRGPFNDGFFVTVKYTIGRAYPYHSVLYQTRYKIHGGQRYDLELTSYVHRTEQSAHQWAREKLAEAREAQAKYGDGWTQVLR